MKIALSTIKQNQVYWILCIEDTSKITRIEFETKVKNWAITRFSQPFSVFTAIESDLYSMIIVLNINQNHEEPQQTFEI